VWLVLDTFWLEHIIQPLITMDTEELKKSLPVTVGKVNSIVAKKDDWSEADLNERTVAFGQVAFTYRDIISFSEASSPSSVSI
jgi:hypothetical protein